MQTAFKDHFTWRLVRDKDWTGKFDIKLFKTFKAAKDGVDGQLLWSLKEASKSMKFPSLFWTKKYMNNNIFNKLVDGFDVIKGENIVAKTFDAVKKNVQALKFVMPETVSPKSPLAALAAAG